MSRFAFYASRLKESVAKRISLRKMRVGRYVTSLYVSLGRILWACFATSGVVEPVHRSVMPVGQPCLMGVSHIERSGHSDRCHGNSAKLSRSGGGDVSHSATIRPERLEQIVRRPVLHHDDDDVALFLLFVDLQQQHGKTCRNYPTRTKYRGSMSFTVWTAPTKFWHATLGQKTGSSSKNPLPVPTNFHSPQEKSRLRKAVFNSRQRPPQLWAVSNVSAWQSREGESTAGSAAIKSVHPDQFS